jgi:hypothetical protein
VLGIRDIAMALPGLGFDPTRVRATDPALYSVDNNFNLTRFQGEVDGDPPQPATFDISTSTVAESAADPLLMMRWGRWSGGAAQTTNQATGEVLAVDLSQASLHWVESADRATAPVLPTTGTINYQLAAWTTPTDRLGNLGTLNSATLDADFTAQTVTSTLDITVGGLHWVANGGGNIGAQVNLPAHQFVGGYNQGQGRIDPIQGQPIGSFSGFFTNTGAGMTYSLGDAQFSGATVEGALVFRKP